jgi:hypothetical protein
MSFQFVFSMDERVNEHVHGRIRTIAIDGKLLRGTYDKEKPALFIWLGLCCRVWCRSWPEDKSNENTAIPEPLNHLVLETQL